MRDSDSNRSDYGQGGNGRGGRGRRGGRGGNGRSGGGRHGRRHPRQSAESGNQRERIAIESGELVLIDQFMLANPQFVEQMIAIVDETPEKKGDLVRQFGGRVISLTSGTYKIERDPFAYTIIVHLEGQDVDRSAVTTDASSELGNIFVDTRCLAMIDRELLDDSSLLQKYQELWFAGEDKACRDLLRDNGGAVRYGFKRDGDDLKIQQIPGRDVVCLWPVDLEEMLAASKLTQNARSRSNRFSEEGSDTGSLAEEDQTNEGAPAVEAVA